MKIFKGIKKFFKFTHLNIAIELFVLFKIIEGCLIFWKLKNILILTFYIDIFSVTLAIIFSGIITIRNIIKYKKNNLNFVSWLMGKDL